MKTKILALLALGALVTGCSGGNAIPPAPKQMAPMTFRVVVPAATSAQSVARKGVTPQYISASTNSVMFVLTSFNGVAQNPVSTTTVALTGSNCSGTPKVCTVSSSEPIGSDSFTVATYYSVSPSWGSDTPLSENSVNYSVVSGSNAISVTLNGVINTLVFSPTSANCASATTACTVAAALNPEDAQGNIIIGPGTYDTTAGAADTITLSCAAPLTPLTATGTTANLSMTGPNGQGAGENNVAQVSYSGSGGTAGGSLTCTATDTQSKTATYVVNLAAAGSVSWTLQ